MNPAEVPAVTVEHLPADAVLLDCREDQQWAAGHIATAVHVPMSQIPARLALGAARSADGDRQLTPDRRIVVVCTMGSRSAHVVGWLNSNGYDAVNLDGGMLAWATSGRPMTTDDGSAPYVA